MPLPAEESLILDCYRKYASDQSFDAGTLDTAGTDWPALLTVAKRTKTFPLLFDCVRPKVPSHFRTHWDKENALRSRSAMSKAQAVLKIRDCAMRIGISPTFVKGVGIGIMLYNGVRHAPYGDVDVVVNSPQELARLDDGLLSDGFHHTHSLIHARMLGDERLLTEFPFRGKWYPDGPQLMMPSSTGYVSVELKTHHSSVATEDMSMFGSDREQIWIQGIPILTYSRMGTWTLLIVRAFRFSDGILSVAERRNAMRAYLDLRVAAERWKQQIDLAHLHSLLRRAAYVDRCSRVLQNLHELCNDSTTYNFLEGWSRIVTRRHSVRSKEFFLYPTIEWSRPFIDRLANPSLADDDLRRAVRKRTFAASNPEHSQRCQLIEDTSEVPPSDRFLVYKCGGASVRYYFSNDEDALAIWISAAGDSWREFENKIIQFRFFSLFDTETMKLDIPVRIRFDGGTVTIERRHARDARPGAGKFEVKHGRTLRRSDGELLVRLSVPRDWIRPCYDAGAPFGMIAYSVSTWSSWSGTLFGPCDTRIRDWPQLIDMRPEVVSIGV